MKRIDPHDLGEPDLKLARLSIWVHGRQFEETQDYWDGNWLRATVHCGSQASDAWAQGAILHLGELTAWLGQLIRLNEKASGEAELSCVEPNLWVKVSLGQLGKGLLEVRIAQDHLTEDHRFTCEIDQSYLPEAVSALNRLLQHYPLRGKAPSG